MTAHEFNLDGLVGQTHNYAGLSPGNLASENNRGSISRPRDAALQGLAKMRALAGRGVRQAVIPPHARPDLDFLRSVGFEGSEARILARAATEAPDMLAAACAASAMWTANAATVSPSADTTDGRVHLTPANLIANVHRALEAGTTTRILRAIFPDESRFAVHDPLPASPVLGDEGAANHTRLCADHAGPGVEMFVYGRQAAWDHTPEKRMELAPVRFPARQTSEACTAIARRHGLDPRRVVLIQQNPRAIDRGVFHNDVISVGNRTLLLHHEEAFVETTRVIDELRARVAETCDADLATVRVRTEEMSVEECVRTYLFNSQILTIEGREGMVLVAPEECRESEAASAVIRRMIEGDSPIEEVLHFDLRQSMRNGGGPACLRLRVVLTEREADAMNRAVVLDEALAERLETWIERHYREELKLEDLADPALLREGRDALDELTRILRLGPVYPFQQ